eukprot:Hpha_TRINITY_DN18461_c0_g1::TRINITY_DN18461_c0_g1_i1::g.165419::m.165419
MPPDRGMVKAAFGLWLVPLVCAELASPNFPPLYTANCSTRESAMMGSCLTAERMCRGYGGTLSSCRKRETKNGGFVIEAACDCFGNTAQYEYSRDVPDHTVLVQESCYVLDECGEPPSRQSLGCRPDVSAASCIGAYAACWYSSAGADYDACLSNSVSATERCNCSHYYYDCMRGPAQCEEFIAQQACDDIVDDYLAHGADPAHCNYLTHCRCNPSSTGRAHLTPLVAIFLASFVPALSL